MKYEKSNKRHWWNYFFTHTHNTRVDGCITHAVFEGDISKTACGIKTKGGESGLVTLDERDAQIGCVRCRKSLAKFGIFF